MVTWTKAAALIWRDYLTDGLPSSGAHKPVKSEIRTWTGEVETYIGALDTDLTAAEGNISTLQTSLAAAEAALATAQTDITTLQTEIYPIARGGTGANTAGGALLNLGFTATAADISTLVNATSAYILTLLDDADALTARATLGALAKAGDAITGGMTASAVNDGSKSTGTYTPDPTDGNIRYVSNAGAFTLAAPVLAGDYTMLVQVVNASGAGAITTTGFAIVTGDDFTLTVGHKFNIAITKCNGSVEATVKALQ